MMIQQHNTLSRPLMRDLASLTDELNLREILNVLNRRKSAIAGSVFMVVALTLLLVFQIQPRYTAETVIMLDPRQTQVVNLESVVSGLPVDMSAVRSEVDILTSRALVGKVVDGMKLVEDADFNAALKPASFLSLKSFLPKDWLHLSSGDEGLTPETQAARTRGEVVNGVLKKLEIRNDGRSYSIHIAFTSTDAEKAARIANAFADTYLVDQLEAKYEATRRATEWLSTRLEDMREKVRLADRAVQDYRESANLIQTRGSTLTGQQMSELNTQLVLARSSSSEAEARLRGVRQMVASGGDMGGASEVLNSPLIQKLREQESSVRRKKAEMANQYGPRHPNMINVDAELSDVQRKIDEEVRKIVRGLDNEAQIARTRVSSLETQLGELEKKSGQNLKAEVGLRELEREAEASRAIYESFLTRFKETSEQEKLQTSDARLISKAEVPVKPSFPSKLLFLIAGTGLGLILGIGLAFVLEWLDHGYRTAAQLETSTGRAVLGLVPFLERNAGKAPAAYAVEKPLSQYSEALRTVRTALHFSNVDQPPRIVMVTSSIPGEGKTTFSTSLARVQALSGNRVLLIDADLRRPRIAKEFGGTAKAYLPEVLAGTKTLEDALNTDSATGLHYILAQDGTPNSQDMLGSQQMQKLLARVRDQYDLIIIDSPPIMAVSDGAMIAKFADTTIFLARWADTPREMVANALRQLDLYGAKVAGVVLSQVNMEQHTRYVHGAGGRYYGRYKDYYTN